MKKVLFIVPLLLAPTLFSCGNNIVDQKFVITFDAGEGYFDNNPGHKIKTIKVKKGETPTLDVLPEKVAIKQNETLHYPFSAWSPELVPAVANTKYVASYNSIADTYYTITFDAGGSQDVPAPIDVKAGECAKMPEKIPVASGMRFDYWTEFAPSMTEPPEKFDFESTPINQDKVLHAQFANNNYIYVKFDALTGSLDGDEDKHTFARYIEKGTTYGDLKNDLSNPTLDSFAFNGYSLNSSGTGKVLDDSYQFNESQIVYASYKFNVSHDDITLYGETDTSFDKCAHIEEWLDPNPVDKHITFTIELDTGKSQKYAMPKTIKISDKDGNPVAHTYSKYERLYDYRAKYTISVSAIKNGLIIISDDTRPTYDVSFSTAPTEVKYKGPLTTVRGDEYSFIAEAKEPGFNEVYRLPNDGKYINIKPEGETQPLARQLYDIEMDEYLYHSKAKITIHEGVVKSNIVVENNTHVRVPKDELYATLIVYNNLLCRPGDYVLMTEMAGEDSVAFRFDAKEGQTFSEYGSEFQVAINDSQYMDLSQIDDNNYAPMDSGKKCHFEIPKTNEYLKNNDNRIFIKLKESK